jgi:hypothetical protein
MSDTETTTMSPKDAIIALSAMKAEYDAALDAKKIAERGSDTTAATVAIEGIRARAIQIAVAITSETITPLRAGRLIFCAAAGLSPSDIKKIAEANRTSALDAIGIILPAGRLENLSRGKGWCRLGSGSNVTWADRAECGGYMVSTPGKWTVGSTDGFSRKDQTSWDVRKIGPFWIAN